MISRNAPAFLCCFIALTYVAFPTRSYYWDGVQFSLQIEQVRQHLIPFTALFHANHLLYSPFGYLLYSAVVRCGATVRAISVLQLVNSILSAAAAWAIFLSARRLTGSQLAALVSSALFAFGATWWKFSTDADAYVISILFLLIAVICVTAARPNIVLAGICHIAAMLFHELAIFAYAPILLALALETGRSKIVRAIRIALYMLTSAACVWLIYWRCYVARQGAGHSTLFSWIASYASDSGFTSSMRQLIGANTASYVKLFAGGKLSLIAQFSSWVVWLSLAICVAGVSAGAILARGAGGEQRQRSPDRKTILVLWAWLLPLAVFLACWDPGSSFHKLFLWPAIVLLSGGYVSIGGRAQMSQAAFVLALAAWNFGAFIWSHAHVSADPVLTLALQIDKELPKSATVFYAAFSPDDWYLDYFAPGRKWMQPTAADISRALAGTSPVCFETTALQTIGHSLQMDPKLSWALVNGQHNIRLECLKRSY